MSEKVTSKMFKVVTTDGTVLFENVLTRAAAELTKGEKNDFLRND